MIGLVIAIILCVILIVFAVMRFRCRRKLACASEVVLAEQPVVRPYPAARDNPDHRPSRHKQILTASPVTRVAEVSPIPEDFMLRRHYWQQLAGQRLAITHPYPTDFTLKRHYQAHLQQILAAAKPITHSNHPASDSPVAEATQTPARSVGQGKAKTKKRQH